MTVGSWAEYNVKAELYNFVTGAWKSVDDYPFATLSVYNYAMVFIPEIKSYFVIGGATGKMNADIVPHIAKLTNGAWSSAGNLKSARLVRLCLINSDGSGLLSNHVKQRPTGQIG